MKKYKWNFVFADSRKRKGSRTIGLSGKAVILCTVVAVVGLVGFVRLAYTGISYVFAVHDAAEPHHNNNRLRAQLDNLEKFIDTKTSDISNIVAYEDNARLKYGLEAINSDVRKAGVGGLPSREDMLYSAMTNDPLIVKAEAMRMQVSSLNHQVELLEATFSQISKHAQKVYGDLAKRPAIWPANGRLTSTFGYRYHPFNGLRLMHEGLDIANHIWTPIYATADGQVKEVSTWTHFGNMVKINHDGEYETLYAHMQKAAVTQGQAIKRGDVIGYIGNTGRSTGPHVHYEVHRGGRPIDPIQFIVPEEQIVD